MAKRNSKRCPDDDKVVCSTITPGKGTKRIAKWKYDAVRAALRKVIPWSAAGVEFRQLAGLVAGVMSRDDLAKLGVVEWYVATVKLHLEWLGELERIPDVVPQRLRLVK